MLCQQTNMIVLTVTIEKHLKLHTLRLDSPDFNNPMAFEISCGKLQFFKYFISNAKSAE